MADSRIPETAEEQLIYANILQAGMYLGLGLVFVTFALYVFGLIQPAVPLSEISRYWAMSSKDYLVAVNTNFLHLAHPPTGWAWVGLLGKGDFLNFIGIALLSGVTIICYLAIIPTLLKKKDTAYVVMALIEVSVLTLAASGILAAGGH